MGMGVVVVASSRPSVFPGYCSLLHGLGWGGQFTDAVPGLSPETVIAGADGLLIADGPPVSPQTYEVSQSSVSDHSADTPVGLDAFHLALIGNALNRDLPILGISRGMQLLNLAFGGSLLPEVTGHAGTDTDGDVVYAKHSIYLSPGSKLAAILGMGGFFRVNSHHVSGLREAQRSPRLLTSAYSLEDGVVEGLESPQHSWVLGVQCRPDRQDEVPAVFSNLFVSFLERAQSYSALT